MGGKNTNRTWSGLGKMGLRDLDIRFLERIWVVGMKGFLGVMVDG